MQIRILGLPSEVDAAVVALHASTALAVVAVSGSYPCRGEGRQVRVYVTALTRAERPKEQS